MYASHEGITYHHDGSHPTDTNITDRHGRADPTAARALTRLLGVEPEHDIEPQRPSAKVDGGARRKGFQRDSKLELL